MSEETVQEALRRAHDEYVEYLRNFPKRARFVEVKNEIVQENRTLATPQKENICTVREDHVL